ncbi:MAG: extracellular solute-binding protein [Clostridia bacterium]|nr:extracellular solute-binding protein [Clostridia bacterium]
MKRKMISLLLSAAMVATLMAGCSNTSTSNAEPAAQADAGDQSEAPATDAAPAASTETIKLTVWAAEEDQDLTNELINGFKEANKDQTFDITVGVESESTAKDTILVDPEAAADVFAFASDQITDLVNAKVLQPVQDVETISSENGKNAVVAATINDTLYAYPMSADNGYFLYYDSSIISEEEAGSWDTLLAACDKAGKKAGMVMASGWYNAGFFFGAGFTCAANEDGSTTLDWNGTSATGVKGTDVLAGMLDISTNSAFLPITDGDTANQIATGTLGAIISGTWDASAVKDAFGDGYAATVLPKFKCGGQDIQMGSVAGYKMIGVNANSKQVGWAMELAKYLTNEESQITRFTQREIGPSNIKAAEAPEVKENIAIIAVTNQNNAYGVVQMAGGNYWEPSKSLGEIIAQGNPDGTDLQELLDNTVEAVAQPVAQ